MSHDHTAGVGRGRLAIVFTITVAILLAEAIGAAITGSLALLADAGHALTDAAGLAMALAAAHLGTRPPSRKRTWGFLRAEPIAAAVQALLLFAVGAYVMVEGVIRLLEPPEIASTGMVIFGLVGLLGNTVGIALLSTTRGQNLNLRAAFLEVVNDALGSAAVVIAAIVIALTGWHRADVVASLLIGVLILPRTVILLREAGRVLLESTPRQLDLDEVRQHLLSVPHVDDVHDLHASQIATGLPTLSAHVVVDDSCFHDGHLPEMLDDLQACVAEHFPVSVEHSTFQFESATHAEHEFEAHP